MDYRFREIRKHECADVLVFAKAYGCTPEPRQLRHHLSLTVKSAGELAAVALCLENEPGHYVIEIVHTDGFSECLIAELADRCLRKVQSEGIASARVKSPVEASTKSLWKQTNWLERIEETPPPDRSPEVSLAGEAASDFA